MSDFVLCTVTLQSKDGTFFQLLQSHRHLLHAGNSAFSLDINRHFCGIIADLYPGDIDRGRHSRALAYLPVSFPS